MYAPNSCVSCEKGCDREHESTESSGDAEASAVWEQFYDLTSEAQASRSIADALTELGWPD